MAVKDMAASVLARLKKQSKETGLNYQMCLQLFCQEEFLRRVGMSGYVENLVLKGGMFLYTLTEFESRPTRDIDFMIRWIPNGTANIKKVMEEICQIKTENNFIRIEVLDAEVITEEKEYPGVKTKLKAYIKNVIVPFSIDVGFDDVIVPNAKKRAVCTRLPDFKRPEIFTYSIESTIAEKFDAILKRMEATSRMKDFFDICFLAGMFDFEGRKLQEAIQETLGHRGTNYDKDSFRRINRFKDNAFMQNLWGNYKKGIGNDCPEFDKIVDQLTEFLEPIFEAIIGENEFFLFWSSRRQGWSQQREAME